ncbi:MAG TPA: hypothetical protein VIW26_11855 [Gemmatimonadales bacterium]
MRVSSPLLLFLATGVSPSVASQQSAGSELWRLAAVTVPLPPSLATGAAATFWTPAQEDQYGQLGLDLLQTPAVVGATGLIGAVRVPVRHFGAIGLVYARMGLGDLVRTTDSPDPVGDAIPFYTQTGGFTWSRTFGHTGVGATATYYDTRFDGTRAERWSLDFGVIQRIGDRARIALSTRGLTRLANDPGQDIDVGAEYRLWRGMLWGTTAGRLVGRYGIGFGHPGGVDHELGAGLDIGTPVTLDVVLTREASYGNVAWRGAAGLRVSVGRYRMLFARDGGISDLGSTFRVGLEASLK